MCAVRRHQLTQIEEGTIVTYRDLPVSQFTKSPVGVFVQDDSSQSFIRHFPIFGESLVHFQQKSNELTYSDLAFGSTTFVNGPTALRIVFRNLDFQGVEVLCHIL